MDPLKTRFGNLQIYSILEHIIPNFMAQQRRTSQNSTNLQRKASICSGPSKYTRIENLQIYSFLEHIIPNFWAPQRRVYQDSTNLQKKEIICSEPSEYNN